METTQKYSKDGPFSEPVLRCDSCNKVVLLVDLKTAGMCPHCGTTRVNNVRTLTDEDRMTVEKWIAEGKVKADWLDLFAPSEVNA